MRPDEQNSGQGGNPLSNQGTVNNQNIANIDKTKQATIEVVRSQIDNIYNSNNQSDAKPLSEKQPVEAKKHIAEEYVSPYKRVHTEHVKPQISQWREYHSAWQNYYQKYYEGYYSHHLEKAKQELEKKAENVDSATLKQEALFDIRQQIVNKIRQHGKKVRSSRHFVPILSGIIAVIIFAFLQYNQIIVANVMAFVSPGTISSQNIIINPDEEISVGPEPLLIIPKINVNVPVKYDIGSDYASQMAAMAVGVAHFAIPGASSHPGQVGNTVISGHSSNDLFDGGDYKFIFAQLDKLESGDTIYANYNSKRYTYLVTKKEVVKPTEVNKVVVTTDKPILTLITCTPLGTSTNRLLVFAEQISPDPASASVAPTASDDSNLKSNSMPGTSPTLLERLFGAN